MIMKKYILLLTLILITPFFIFFKPSKTIFLTTMGNVKHSEIVMVKNQIESSYNGYEVIILPKVDLMTDTKVVGLNKYQAEKILNNINKKFSDKKGKVVLLTNVDICFNNGKGQEHWGIFGLGQVFNKPCVVSTYRLKKNKNEKLKKIVVHELGHTFGLFHCDYDRKCLMNDAKGKGSTIDYVNNYFCESCNTKLKYFSKFSLN